MPRQVREPVTDLRAWIVDPISHSGMAYYDAGLATALEASGIRVRIAGSESWLLHERASIDVRPLFRGTHGSHNRLMRGLRYGASVLRVVRAVRRDRAAVVHWQYVEVAVVDLVAFWLLRAMGIPLLLTMHETVPWGGRAVDRMMTRLLARSASGVVVHHAEDIPVMRQYGVPDQRIHRLDHGGYELFATPGVPPDLARRALGLGDEPLVLFFGSMRPSKGLDDLLLAWRGVTEHVAAARLAIVGPPYRGHGQHLAERIHELGLSGSVLLRLGTIDPEETNSWYRAADVVVLPYREITTSGVLRYAFSSGCAVVATDVGEHASLVEHMGNGVLVPPQAPPALSDAIVHLLEHPAERTAMAVRALDAARERLSWAPVGVAAAALYTAIAARASAQDRRTHSSG
jgi:D-inositol-3-phosphate glycosyltransferase